MTEATAPLPFFTTDPPPDLMLPIFDFTIIAYVTAPVLIPRDNEPPEQIYCRQADDDVYRQCATPTMWNRYVNLAYHSTIGREFEEIWKNRYDNPLRFYRLVWYNQMYYVDRSMDMPPKLHAWATQLAQPFLLEYDPISLDMDTEKFTWSILIAQLEKHSSLTQWLQVGKKNRSSSRQTPPSSPKSRPQMNQEKPSLADRPSVSEYKQINFATLPTAASQDIDVDMSPVPLTGHSTATDTSSTSTPPLSKTQPPTNDERIIEDVSDAKQSAFNASTDITVNDGTHRICIRWKVEHDLNALVRNQSHLFKELHAILTTLFSCEDGNFFHWDSSSLLSAPHSVSDLTDTNVKEFISPVITTLSNTKQVIFEVRFAFATNPVAWRSQAETQEAMITNKLKVSVSNTMTKSGNLVTAGYVLLKHPSMTHRHRYLVYLRSRLPISTPYFDILFRKYTPNGQKN